MDMHISEYQWLSCWAALRGKLLYKLYPKHHYAKHLAAQTYYLNPVACWTYKQADWVGQLSRMVLSCAYGVRKTTLPLKAARKWRLFYHIRLQEECIQDEDE